MGVYLYSIGIDDSKQTQYSQNKLALESCVDNIDTTLNNMAIFTSQIAQSSNILRLSNMSTDNTNFIMTGYNSMETLSNQRPTEMLLPIMRYYVYLPNSSYCLSSSIFCTDRNYYLDTQNASENYMKAWASIHTNTSLYMKLVNISEYVPKANNTYLYMVPLSTYTLSKNYNSVACFQFSENTLSSFFTPLSLYDSGFVIVTDDNGNELFSVKGKNSSDYNIDDIRNKAEKNSYSEYSIDDDNMFITSVSSESNGWSYYLVQPYNAAFSTLVTYKNTFTFITGIAFLVGLIIILISSIKNAKPMIELNSELNETKKQHTSLQTELEHQRPIIFSSYIERIMLGKVYSSEELNYIANFLGIEQTDKKFFVLYMSVYNNPDDMFSEDIITGEIEADETSALNELRASVKKGEGKQTKKLLDVLQNPVTNWDIVIPVNYAVCNDAYVDEYKNADKIFDLLTHVKNSFNSEIELTIAINSSALENATKMWEIAEALVTGEGKVEIPKNIQSHTGYLSQCFRNTYK